MDGGRRAPAGVLDRGDRWHAHRATGVGLADRRVVVVGAGPAGTRAAERLAAAGLRPVVIDEAAMNGGQIYRRQPAGYTRPLEALYGLEASRAARVHGAFDALAGLIDHRPQTLVWHIYDGVLRLLNAPRRSGSAMTR